MDLIFFLLEANAQTSQTLHAVGGAEFTGEPTPNLNIFFEQQFMIVEADNFSFCSHIGNILHKKITIFRSSRGPGFPNPPQRQGWGLPANPKEGFLEKRKFLFVRGDRHKEIRSLCRLCSCRCPRVLRGAAAWGTVV